MRMAALPPTRFSVSPFDFKRFADFITVVNDCWEWQGSLNPKGYGQFKLDGEVQKAHRVAYQWWNGDLIGGLQVHHLCYNTCCVNPKHLEQVSPRENTLDGEGLAAQNSQKTHCPNGHPYSTEGSTGYRICLVCKARQNRESRARKKAHAKG